MSVPCLAIWAVLAAGCAGCVPLRYADCGNGTIRLDDDPSHCGRCHASCPEGVPCVRGRCAIPEGATVCGEPDEAGDPGAAPRWRRPEDSGCGAPARSYREPRPPVRCRVIDPARDPAHCGVCGNACPAGATCVDGDCACKPGRTRCLVARSDNPWSGDGSANEPPDPELEPWRWDDPATLDRFERRCVDPATDAAHCGGCNRTCPAAAECVDGECRCGDGRTFCPRETAPWETLEPPDAAGVCLDLTTSQASCGACGNACADNERCVDGRCVPCCEEPAAPGPP
ncbi:MAG: hypothetical protein JXB32_08560 [Deltaproteobacteria bacterium]|nr:hypothetical protein [Deltaproteobacteria bacterium]